ncbi:iron ABC transporter permease [Planococcus glaciei]|jgi:iron complex transport system permease protein|uniref:Iron chelate uptake ABC transporter family permease subunit n=1 Tax=Planococcus glaciei TaxID=459472 RepID=A0A1G7Z233_9BACL|nr:iron chelate uptake ABC transporter family permease subunit [Planococcus glaciei]ETP68513.1 iron ABC transporter permease [Planococcus glaciei CHR43]KOF10854.1 iron ABC transporter permease [Planococcus glaciei]MBX0315503.1 iron chelate uptake ABC transporter family permease subunit [Planococcus glaciei]QDY45615.1 iron chelate uptake ABC transporter family permease subunit [Planococcus glaciei]QKX50780.1 iron chelate uptake ABC transporter family permease subunit [Planococcus glaciei]
MRDLHKMLILVGLALAACGVYLFQDLNGSFDYALPRRGVKVFAMVLTGVAIAYATVVFQTISHNRILTPSIMGLDSLYMMLQTLLIFFLGSDHITIVNKQVNFLLSIAVMVVFALLFYQLLFKKNERPIYFLLLVGIICGTFFGSISTFLQVLIDPNEFSIIQDRMFASFNNVNEDLVWTSLVFITLLIAFAWKQNSSLDVLTLGRDTAINLGVNYDALVKQMLVLSAVLIAIATALVGPITFFGLIVANLSYQFFTSYKHSVLLTGSIVISVVALVGGQWVVERIFTFNTTLSVIINFIGGVYFIYLLLKESRSK